MSEPMSAEQIEALATAIHNGERTPSMWEDANEGIRQEYRDRASIEVIGLDPSGPTMTEPMTDAGKIAPVPRTPITPVRVPLDVKDAAAERAKQDGLTLSAVVIAALREYAAGTWTPS